MLDLITFAAPTLVLGILYCLYRAATLLTAWRPAAAVVWGSDHDETQQFDDRWGMGALRGWRLADGDHSRLIEETVHYQDEAGERHVADVGRYVRRGWRPDGAHVIWYDTANPGHATGFGPGYWLMIALSLGAILVLIFRLGMQFHG